MKSLNLFAIVVFACLTACQPSTAPENGDNSKKLDSTEVGKTETVTPKPLATNWKKPLFSLDEKGDTVCRWKYNDKGLLVCFNAQDWEERYTYDGTTVTYRRFNDGKEDQKNVTVYADETYTKVVSVNGNKFEYNEQGKVVKSHDAFNWYSHTYDAEGRISQIVALNCEYADEETTTYSYEDGKTVVSGFYGSEILDSLGRRISSEGDCWYTWCTYEKNKQIEKRRPEGECAGVDSDGNIDGKPAPVTTIVTYYAQE